MFPDGGLWVYSQRKESREESVDESKERVGLEKYELVETEQGLTPQLGFWMFCIREEFGNHEVERSSAFIVAIQFFGRVFTHFTQSTKSTLSG